MSGLLQRLTRKLRAALSTGQAAHSRHSVAGDRSARTYVCQSCGLSYGAKDLCAMQRAELTQGRCPDLLCFGRE